MFKKINRFHGHGAIRFVLGRGKVVRSRLVSLRYANGTTLKIAVVVSKKVAKSAVVRNRIRRRVYAFVRELLLPETTTGQYVFLVYSADVADLPADKLRVELKKLLAQRT